MGYRTDRAVVLLPQTTIAGAVTNQTGPVIADVLGMQVLSVQAVFVRAAGGTTVKAWVQTTIDGSTFFDIACFAFTTASATRVSSVRAGTPVAAALTLGSGVLADNTLIDGVLGSGLRVLYSTTGIYSGSTHLTLTAVVQG